MPKVQSLVDEIQKESEATSRMLERVPADKLDWQPHPKSKSVGDLAYHIAALPALVANVLRRDDFDAAAPRPAMPRDAPPVAVFRRNLDEALRHLQAAVVIASSLRDDVNGVSVADRPPSNRMIWPVM